MADLRFDAQLTYSGTGKEGEGRLTIGEKTFVYSAPENMGGKGAGLSPEDLLISAVSTCYSGTLFGLLSKIGLPAQEVKIQAEGIVTGYPLNTKFSEIIVHPTILGGDASKMDEYAAAAVKAKNKCFIGKSIAGNIDYTVGTVRID